MAKILVVDDEVKITTLLSKIADKLGHETTGVYNLHDAIESCNQKEFDLVFLDLNLPDGNGLSIVRDILKSPSVPEVVIITGTGNIKGAELSFEYGAWDFIPKPLSNDLVKLTIVRALQYREEKNAAKRPKLLSRDNIIGDSSELNSCLEQVANASGSDVDILITGETGTGKELIAKAIHNNSSRKERDFVVVDCAALPSTLIESVMFGHEKGAFTDAVSRSPGLVKLADQGTLFLDEVGELPFLLQKVFLRFLQERRFRPVGATSEEVSNFRLIAATNRDLQGMVDKGTFRQDLLYRLRAMSIHIPPLRARRADIRTIALHHLEKSSSSSLETLKGCSPEFFKALSNYHWPGNVRELLNTIDHTIMAASDAPVLYPIHLPIQIRLPQVEQQLPTRLAELADQIDPTSLSDELPTFRDFKHAVLRSAEKRYLDAIMSVSERKIKLACKIAGLSESRLHALLKEYRIPRSRNELSQ